MLYQELDNIIFLRHSYPYLVTVAVKPTASKNISNVVFCFLNSKCDWTNA